MFRSALDRLKQTHFATRLDRWLTASMAVLLFALGFVAGRWTSFTTQGTPIVFQEAPGGASVASREDLQSLVTAEETPEPRSSPPLAPSPKQSEKAPAQKKEERAGEVLGAYVASANGKKYYHPSCTEVRRIKDENRIWFDSAEEAKESGYEPSVCVQKGRSR